MGFSNFSGPPPDDTDDNNNGLGGIGSLFPGGMAGSGNKNDTDPTELLINYNEEFANAGTILFRDQVIEQTLAVLVGKTKPNALLIGPAGVGKTKIVEDIAFRLVSKHPLIPDALKDAVIYELPLTNIVSGSIYVGQVEEKIQSVLDFAKDPKNHVILFIDEIHRLVTSTEPTYQKIAQILKPELARGKIRVIGATTTQEAGDLDDDPAFNRRFSKIIVDELTKAQTVEVLSQARAGFLAHYKNKISISDGILETVVNLTDDYHAAGSHRPDNALTLLDRTIGDAIVNRKMQEINAANDPVILQALQALPVIPITERQVRKTAIRMTTGNSKPETLDVEKLRAALSTIRGQDDVIEKLIRRLQEHELGLFPKTRPMTMLFIGPSGVGKTEVTKRIAKELTGTDPIILNMTEYHNDAAINRIIGSPPGYVGYSSHMELPFDSLESNPYQIILLDEFEKCDSAVKTLFMQAFDEGYIKTNKGKRIDFSKSIIIATTNAGHTDTISTMGFSTGTDSTTETNVNDLSQWFDLALLNRFNDRITFHPIEKDVYRDILQQKYASTIQGLKEKQPRITLADTIPEDDLNQITEESYVPEFGARPAEETIKEYILGHILP